VEIGDAFHAVATSHADAVAGVVLQAAKHVE
jgi:hypothetical protein